MLNAGQLKPYTFIYYEVQKSSSDEFFACKITTIKF